MTMPFERYSAINRTAKFLKELATDREKYPRIPKDVRRQALSLLRHYPMQFEMEMASEKVPELFKKDFP